MPIATTLPSRNVTLRFPTSANTSISPDEAGIESYQLLELPAEILKQVEGGKSSTFPLTIKGRPSDDAVLCTPTTTFQLRTITVSNSLLICRAPRAANGVKGRTGNDDLAQSQTLEIRDVSHEILECVPQAPNLERIRTVLRESQWRGMGSSDQGLDGKRRKVDGREGGPRKRWTRAQLESVIQASEQELEDGLKERNVIEVDGRMLLLPPKELVPLLTLILTVLTIHSTISDLTSTPPLVKCPVPPIYSTLEDDHDVSSGIIDGVLGVFGEVKGEEWTCDVRRAVKEVGRGLLQAIPASGRSLDEFLDRWRDEVGETWSELVKIGLLEGSYLLDDPPASTAAFTKSKTIKYFPLHNLPLHTPTRFSDLFLTRQRWRPDEMTPFLKGLTRDGDKKELDKLIAKFVRVVKEKEGVWWYPRRTG